MIDADYLKKLESIVSSTTDNVLNQYFRQTTAQTKQDGSIVTEADVSMQRELQSELHKLSPDILMLGEEMEPVQQQEIINSGSSYWCLDPLDGTNNFHHGVPLFAVSVALVVNREIRIGVVYDPVRKEIFSALKGNGLRVNGSACIRPQQPEQLAKCLASVDFKRLQHGLKERLLRQMPFKSQRNIGTCALEWAWLAAGRLQLLLHGGEKFWDYAAGSLLLSESTGTSCTDKRDAIFNSSLDARPVIAASTDSLHRSWVDFLLD